MKQSKETNIRSDKNIYLIGYMGCGKTTVAKVLGDTLEVVSMDLDELICNHFNKSIPEIFDDLGEDGFRAIESLFLFHAVGGTIVPYDATRGAVLSCGGGTVLDILNVNVMRATGIIIWLKASAETVFSRIKDDCSRPLLSGKMTIQDIQEMMEFREPFYSRAADYTIETDKKTPEEIAGEIITKLNLIPNPS